MSAFNVMALCCFGVAFYIISALMLGAVVSATLEDWVDAWEDTWVEKAFAVVSLLPGVNTVALFLLCFIEIICGIGLLMWAVAYPLFKPRKNTND